MRGSVSVRQRYGRRGTSMRRAIERASSMTNFAR
jgi:hypothetical protein